MKMTHQFNLPEAERFSSHLEREAQGILTAQGPRKVNDNVREWEVQLDGQRLGEYSIIESPPGNIIGYVYQGRVPGYVNPAWCGSGSTEDNVALQFSKVGFEDGWTRKDRHDIIPFP